MIVEIKLIRDDGTVVKEATTVGDAMKPLQFKTQYEKPLGDGTYLLFMYTYQPQVILDPKRNRQHG